MRARRREINIFNMSLLDILCGALGAFCFMMLVALPYYIPPGSGLELRKAQQETDRLLRAVESMKDRMPDQKSVDEMEALMRQLEAQIKTLQGRVNMMQSQNDDLKARLAKLQSKFEDLLGEANELQADKLLLQDAKGKLTAENKKLTDANKQLVSLMERRRGFVVAAHSATVIDLLLTDELSDAKKGESRKAEFKNWLDGEMPTSALHSFLSTSGNATEIRTDVNPKRTQKIFVRLTQGSNVHGPADVEGAIFTMDRNERVLRLPKVTLSPQRFWAFLGTISIDQNFEPIFKEATVEERDAEWQTLTNSTSPPAPTPTPPPSAEALREAEAARLARQASGKKFARLRQLRGLNSEESEAEILKLTDELLKELPASDGMRREVTSMREQVLAAHARRASPTP